MNHKLSVAGVQYLHQQGDREGNLRKAADFIRSSPGRDLYVMPELASSGYGREAFEQLDDLAEDADGPSFQAFSALAREMNAYICYSFPRNAGKQKPTICAAVVDRNGDLVVCYDKWHVCQYGECAEKIYFDAGDSEPGVFSIDGIKVGVMICYDIRFPELARKLTVDHGVSLIIHPGGWPRDEGYSTWHTFVVTRAIENTAYIMSPNRAGDHNGGSIFCAPFTDLMTHFPDKLEKEEGVLTGEVDMARLAQARETFTVLADRRSDLY